MSRHERALRPTRDPSAPARFELAWARFSNIARELRPLFTRHWEEIAADRDLIPLDPDWDRYYELDWAGVLRILTARADGELVGYAFNLIGPHLHYVSTVHAHTEMFWLDPRFRQGWDPVRMFIVNRDDLKAMGAQVHSIGFKLSFQQGRVGKMFKRLGYTPTDIVMKQVF